MIELKNHNNLTMDKSEYERLKAELEARLDKIREEYEKEIKETHAMKKLRIEAVKEADREQFEKAKGDIAKQYKVDTHYQDKRNEINEDVLYSEKELMKEYEAKKKPIEEELEKLEEEYQKMVKEESKSEQNHKTEKGIKESRESKQKPTVELTEIDKPIEAEQKLQENSESKQMSKETYQISQSPKNELAVDKKRLEAERKIKELQENQRSIEKGRSGR